jgi:hypothetical protein
MRILEKKGCMNSLPCAEIAIRKGIENINVLAILCILKHIFNYVFSIKILTIDITKEYQCVYEKHDNV